MRVGLSTISLLYKNCVGTECQFATNGKRYQESPSDKNFYPKVKYFPVMLIPYQKMKGINRLRKE